MIESRKRVVVIGAGLAGLACAYRLKTLGVDVALVEKAGLPGGIVRSELIDGYLIERGPNSTRGTLDMLDLLDELGLAEELVEGDPKAPAFIYFKGQLHSVPAGAGAFFKSKLLTFGAKVRMFTEPFRSSRKSDEEESIASFVNRRLGPQVTERMVTPFLAGIYAGDAEHLGVEAAFPSLAKLEREHGSLFKGLLKGIGKARNAKPQANSKAGSRAKPKRKTKRLISFSAGMAALPKRLAEKVGEDFIPDCSDVTIDFGGADPRFAVKFARSGHSEQFVTDNLVVAIPSFAATDLVRPASAELADLLNEIKYPALAVVYLGYDRASIRERVEGFGFLTVPGQGLGILGCLYTSCLFENRSPEGEMLFTIFVGGTRNPGVAGMTDTEVAALAHRDLQKALGVTSDPHIVGITRYERAIPQFNVGHAARLRRIKETLKGTPGLHLIGNYISGVSTGDCLKDGERLARELAEQ
ncbi:MAG: protoporphyrinogen oxidase [Blastocatellia bacterium]